MRSSHIAAAQIAFMIRSTTEAENEFSAASIPIIVAPPGSRAHRFGAARPGQRGGCRGSARADPPLLADPAERLAVPGAVEIDWPFSPVTSSPSTHTTA